MANPADRLYTAEHEWIALTPDRSSRPSRCASA